MDRAISLEARRVDLAVEPAFRLGAVRIDPPAHEIAWADESRRIQPQTLKVLVALHDKIGQVVTREELVERCWDGRFVGDDVINRCISLLRRIASESGGIQIQTVPRGGYRLLDGQQTRREEDARIDPASASGPTPLRKRIAAGGAAFGLLAMGAIGLFLYQRPVRPPIDAVVLKPFDVAGNAAPARTMAAGVSGDVAGALSAAGLHVIDPGASGGSGDAAFALRGRVELAGANLHLTAELQDTSDQSVLWSTTFTRPTAQMQAMQEQVSANLAAVLHCALDTSRPAKEGMDQDTTKLYLEACALQQSVGPPLGQISDLLKQVTARRPRFAVAWARLALASADAAFTAPPEEANAMRREARAAAGVALRLDAKSGLAYEALTNMELGHVPFAQLHREFRRVLSLDPNNASVINDDGELLMRMGSLRLGVHLFRRGVELDPLSPAQASDLIKGLIDDSLDNEAQATLQRALRIWPDDNMLRVMHLDYEARFGDPRTALAILDDPDARPQKVHDVTLEAYRRLALARGSGQPAQIRAFMAWLRDEVASGRLGVDFAAPHMAQFGDVDGAFKLAFAAPPDVIAIDPEFLWEPESLPLRRDRRFVALAAKFHVADFWTSTGLWPDFCAAPDWPYHCKAERALSSSRRARL